MVCPGSSCRRQSFDSDEAKWARDLVAKPLDEAAVNFLPFGDAYTEDDVSQPYGSS